MKRRTFLAGSAAAAVVPQFRSVFAQEGDTKRKLRLAVIGVANRGAANLQGVSGEEIVALCDVDSRNLTKARGQFSGAELFRDYRVMLDQFEGLDGVVVSTPDHHHAPATMRALDRGLPVYCEKPLTHTVAEARAITNAAIEKGVPTQMGTQIHAGNNYRRVVEKIRAGILGDVHRVHVWVGKGWGSTSVPTPDGSMAPEHLDWDLWLGAAEDRPYTPGYHPANWRSYRDFGTGTLGDMGCHYMDLPFWALGLKYPKRVVADGPAADAECCPLGLSVRYEFAASDSHGDLTFTWYDGDRCPKGELEGMKIPHSGVLFVGSKGKMVATYGGHEVVLNSSGNTAVDKTLPASIGHHREWLEAIRGGDASKPLCRFEYSGPLTETVLLGTVAHQVGRPIDWDGNAAQVSDDDEAQKLLEKAYRPGWELKATVNA